MRPTVIVLSFNSEETLGETLRCVRLISDEIFVVDSYSKDGTVDVARAFGATVVQHPFEHYGAQRNWAIDNLPITRPWQLHLDQDELMDDELVAAIQALPDEPEHSGYFLPRYVRFLGRVLRHGGMSPTWHMRLFRTGVGRSEDRKYDSYFILKSGSYDKLTGTMVDDNQMPLTEWTARHNRWSDLEVAEMKVTETSDRVSPTHAATRTSASDSSPGIQPAAAVCPAVRPFRLSLLLAPGLSGRQRRAHFLGAANLLVPLPGRRQDMGETTCGTTGPGDRGQVCI